MSLAGRTHRRMLSGARILGVATGVTAAAAAALVAGCTSGGSSSASSSAPAPPATSAAPSTPAPASSSPASAPASAPLAPPSSAPAGGTAAGGTPACSTSGLQATAGLSQGAAGSIYQVIDFKNISGAPCTLFGYPGVALAGGSPVTQIGAAATRNAAAPATQVTLAAGATANALLRITQAANYPPSKCKPETSTYLQIYPPNQTTPIYLAYKSTGCSSTAVPPILSIGVVQAGSGG